MSQTIAPLIEVMAALRDPQRGCPWDLEQTFKTIAPYTLEEAYEVSDAIDHDDMNSLKSELGDLLFQVVFHARMAEEQGAFSFDDVVESIVEKMVRRHPHVFGDSQIEDKEAQTEAWEHIKAEERAVDSNSHLDGIAKGLPQLKRAEKIQKRAARVGFDWDDPFGVLIKVTEEINELEIALAEGEEINIEDEIGDLMFSLVNLARHENVDPEHALLKCNNRFIKRFQQLEAIALDSGKDVKELSLEEMNLLWEMVKSQADE